MTPQNPGKRNATTWIALYLITAILLAIVGSLLIKIEPYRTLWNFAAGLIAGGVWFFVRRWWENNR